MAIEGFGIIQGITGFDWLGLGFKLINVMIVIFALWIIIYFFILRPKKYNFKVTILDVSAGGLILSTDRGGWIDDKTTRTGEFRLMKDKQARLKMPDRSFALTTKKGKLQWTLIKYGDGPFDYGVVDYKDLKDLCPSVIQLSDIDWARSSVQRASIKKELGKGFLAANKATIITLTAVVMAMIIVGGAVKMAADSSQSIISMGGSQIEQYTQIAESLDNVANKLEPNSNPSSHYPISVPPP